MLARAPLSLDIGKCAKWGECRGCGGCGGTRRLLAVRGDRFDSLHDAADNPLPTARAPAAATS